MNTLTLKGANTNNVPDYLLPILIKFKMKAIVDGCHKTKINIGFGHKYW